jgi:hypothetical protein
MSILQTVIPVASVLGLYGAPCRTFGLQYWRLMIPLNFYLQVGGPISVVFDMPSPLQSCQDGNSGIQIVVYVLDQLANPANISSASSTSLLFMRPDETTFNRVASFVTSGMDGGLFYTVLDTDFLQDGLWQVQASFTLAGDKKTTRIGSFVVGGNIIAP